MMNKLLANKDVQYTDIAQQIPNWDRCLVFILLIML